ncbi:MAG: DUF2087 domain-containing protein [Ethanoligenens sp.]
MADAKEMESLDSEALERVKKAFFDKDGNLRSLPSKQSKKQGVLQVVVHTFEKDVHYTEKEINDRLKVIYADFATLRRTLIDFGFLNRTADGKTYWREK